MDLRHLYCDESGNTGARLFDPDQPFFSYGFVMLDPAVEARLRADIGNICASGGGRPPQELKSTKLWGSKSGLRKLKEIASAISQSEGVVFIGQVEKRYQACIMIVETYLDPMHNPAAPPENDPGYHRRTLADQIYTVSDDSFLEEFLDVCSADDVEGIRRFGERLAHRLSLHRDRAVADAGKLIAGNLSAFHRFGQRIPGAPKNMHLTSAQGTVFLPALRAINDYLVANGIRAKLLRDRDKQFGAVLDFAYGVLTNPSLDPTLEEFGVARPALQFHSSEEVENNDDFGCQLADVVAGVTNRATSIRAGGKKLTAHQRRAWDEFRRLIPSEDHCFEIVSPGIRRRRLLAR